MESNCLTCPHLKDCEKCYGRIGIDVENCTAIEGTHFCLLSWKNCVFENKNGGINAKAKNV